MASHNLCTFIGRATDSMLLLESMDSTYQNEGASRPPRPARTHARR